jgi:hypothetical protein
LFEQHVAAKNGMRRRLDFQPVLWRSVGAAALVFGDCATGRTRGAQYLFKYW